MQSCFYHLYQTAILERRARKPFAWHDHHLQIEDEHENITTLHNSRNSALAPKTLWAPSIEEGTNVLYDAKRTGTLYGEHKVQHLQWKTILLPLSLVKGKAMTRGLTTAHMLAYLTAPRMKREASFPAVSCSHTCAKAFQASVLFVPISDPAL